MIERIALVTGNPGKAAEFAALLGIDVTPVKAGELTEIQSLDVAEVAARKAADAYALLGEPVLVDDTGLTFREWNGLPGALIAWFVETVGAQGILDMTRTLTDRTATAVTALGYADANGVQVFTGAVTGTLATEPRGNDGFGYDPIFIPDHSDGRTFAQMTSQEKNKISHRARAVEAMRNSLGLAAPAATGA
jgi:non-canonical purine NTP pyrophosphatase (RdgB/HAM1 family)